MESVQTFSVGVTVYYDGDAYQVVGLDGRRTTLQSWTGRRCVILTSTLLSDPTFSVSPVSRPKSAGIGPLMSNLPPEVEAQAIMRAAHLDELIQGLPRPDDPDATDPRPEYDPKRPWGERLLAKATELDMTERALRRWVRLYRDRGVEGLVDRRRGRNGNAGRDIDTRWTDAVRAVLAEHTNRSRPTKKRVLQLVEERLDTQYGPGVVLCPPTSTAYKALDRLTKGTNAFRGSTKQKRSIANGPRVMYSRLVATRPGEYVLLDTTRLDVFGIDPITERWVEAELTVAMDLCDRRIVGMCLRPVSTKAVDVAAVLYETIHPSPHPGATMSEGPYSGVPNTVIHIDSDDTTERQSVDVVDTIVIDHGKVFISEHVKSVCARLGISIQPGRPYTPTDKAPVERFFRTLREDLLETLPGYKGPDVYSRGLDVEKTAVYFIHELDAIIRGWIAEVYHRRPHSGLVIPEAPGVAISPLEMHEYALTKAGYLRILTDWDLAFDFLPTAWRSIQRYGVELHGLRYQGAVLEDLVNTRSKYGGVHRGKWPIRYDPNDIRQVYFQDADDEMHLWHRLDWTHRHVLGGPFSLDALNFAKQVAIKTGRHDDVLRVIQEHVERWRQGAAEGRPEKRIALQQALHLRTLGLDGDASTPSTGPTGRIEPDEATLGFAEPDLEVDDEELDEADYYADTLDIAI